MSTDRTSQKQRAMGAIMGAFVGDALGLGPHWYYDLDELRATYGDWIDGYTKPQEGRYHAGLEAGASSQSGLLLELTINSLLGAGGYDEADFCKRLDEELFPQLDGNAMAGPGGFTSQSIRDSWRLRQQGVPWGQVAGWADNTEAAERCVALAVRYAGESARLAAAVSANAGLTQRDPTVLAMTTAYCVVLGQLVAGEPLDSELSGKLMALVQSDDLPFHAGVEGQPDVDDTAPMRAGQFASPDALLTVSSVASAAAEHLIEPAWKASLVYGLPCAVYHQFPAAYYLAARFQGEVECTLLHAINGGGQNQARAILAGALSGAIGGIGAMPPQLLDGLQKRDSYLALAARLAEASLTA